MARYVTAPPGRVFAPCAVRFSAHKLARFGKPWRNRKPHLWGPCGPSDDGGDCSNRCMTQDAAPDRLLTHEDVADLLAATPRFVRHLVTTGRLPVVHLGPKTPRFRAADVEQLIERGVQ